MSTKDETTVASVRLRSNELAALDRFAERAGTNRAEALRLALVIATSGLEPRPNLTRPIQIKAVDTRIPEPYTVHIELAFR